MPEVILTGAAGRIEGRYSPAKREKAPIALQLSKEAVKFASRSNLDEGLRREVDLFAICFSTEDKQEGVAAFLEKRKPDFKGK